MTLRSAARSRLTMKPKLNGAMFALMLGAMPLGLVACANTDTPTSTAPATTFTLTVKFTGVSGPLVVTITAPDGTKTPYTVQSGAIISGLKGIYTVTGPDVGGKTTPAQTIDLSTANQTVTLAY